jgi:hypothetical protein
MPRGKEYNKINNILDKF